MAKQLPSGHRVAYLVLVLGMAASVTGNVSNILLTPSGVTDWLRVPISVLWPVLTYLGIEVLTRVDWSRTWQHWMARAILLGPMASVSAFMSYLHLHHLMILSGEPGLAQAVGPLAIDGSLFGATVALLVTRQRSRVNEDGPKLSLAQRVANTRQGILAVTSAAKGGAAVDQDALDAQAAAAKAKADQAAAKAKADQDALDAAKAIVDNADMTNTETAEDVAPKSPPKPPREYATRNDWDVAKAVQLLLEGDRTNTEIGNMVGISDKMIQRARRAVRLLKSDPSAAIPAEWRVPAQVLDVARREIRAAG